MTGTLILVRHGQSEWNLQNLFTGWRNPNLTEQGIEEARATGKALKAAGIMPDLYYLRFFSKTSSTSLRRFNRSTLESRDTGALTGTLTSLPARMSFVNRCSCLTEPW